MSADSNAELQWSDAAYRRIAPWEYIFDSNQQRWRPSSSTFQTEERDEFLSSYAESALIQHSLSPNEALKGHPKFGLARVAVALLHEHSFKARLDPKGINPDRPHPCDLAHAVVTNTEGGPRLSEGACRRLAKHPELQVVVEAVTTT